MGCPALPRAGSPSEEWKIIPFPLGAKRGGPLPIAETRDNHPRLAMARHLSTYILCVGFTVDFLLMVAEAPKSTTHAPPCRPPNGRVLARIIHEPVACAEHRPFLDNPG